MCFFETLRKQQIVFLQIPSVFWIFLGKLKNTLSAKPGPQVIVFLRSERAPSLISQAVSNLSRLIHSLDGLNGASYASYHGIYIVNDYYNG